MKKNLKFFAVALFILTTVLSCSKDDDDVANPSSENIRKLLLASNANTSTTYEYHTDGRLIKETLSTGSHIDYSYTDNQIIHSVIGGGNSMTNTCDLNTDGMVSTIFHESGDVEYLEYDEAGHRIKSTIEFDGGGYSITNYTISNGNTISTSSESSAGGTFNTQVHLYYENEKNTISGVYIGKDFLGTTNRNPKKKTTIYNFNDVYTIEFSYDYDEEGYILNKKEDWYKNGEFQSANTVDYTYE